MVRQLFAAISLTLALVPSSSLSLSCAWPALEREFQAAVQIWTIDDNRPKYLCSGVVIAPDTVLTAASCVYGKEKNEKAPALYVSTALNFDYKAPLTRAPQSVRALNGIRHHDHDIDLMLIFLSQPLNVEPALLLSPGEASRQIRLLNQVILAGYGNRESPAEPTSVQRLIERLTGGGKVPQAGEKLIAKSRILDVSAKEILIGKTRDDGSACSGDEGAPVFAHLIDTPFSNSQRVLGIIISSNLLPGCGQPSIALRLDAFRNFINEKMVQECRNGSRMWCKVEGLLAAGYDEENVLEKKPEVKEEVITKPNKSNDEPKTPPKEPIDPLTSARPVSSKPASQTTPKAAKRRLSVNAEGAGCSCQQVFTSGH